MYISTIVAQRQIQQQLGIILLLDAVMAYGLRYRVALLYIEIVVWSFDMFDKAQTSQSYARIAFNMLNYRSFDLIRNSP